MVLQRAPSQLFQHQRWRTMPRLERANVIQGTWVRGRTALQRVCRVRLRRRVSSAISACASDPRPHAAHHNAATAVDKRYAQGRCRALRRISRGSAGRHTASGAHAPPHGPERRRQPRARPHPRTGATAPNACACAARSAVLAPWHRRTSYWGRMRARGTACSEGFGPEGRSAARRPRPATPRAPQRQAGCAGGGSCSGRSGASNV